MKWCDDTVMFALKLHNVMIFHKPEEKREVKHTICGLLKHVSVFCVGVSVYVWEALVDHPPHCVG